MSGWASDERVWEQLITELPNATVQHIPASADEQTIEHTLQTLDQPIIIAWSMGAMRALDYVATHQVKALIVIAGSLSFKDLWPEHIVQKMKADLQSSPETLLDEFQQNCFSKNENEARDNYQKIFSSESISSCFSPTELQQGLDYLTRFHLPKEKLSLLCPTLWIHGTEDRIIPIKSLELPESIQLNKIENCGHIPQFTEAKKVAQQINIFLAAL
ncbi:MAG: alpha/beta hydrolase [Lentisphaeria bacterium]|nr:alpha/beta hydrolase [Lentisphaeria bacterium]NQZ70679.1 alpha/beta hydrolase [Lentisphaeria bacterium]